MSERGPMPLFDEDGEIIATAHFGAEIVNIVRPCGRRLSMRPDLFWAIRPATNLQDAHEIKRLSDRLASVVAEYRAFYLSAVESRRRWLLGGSSD